MVVGKALFGKSNVFQLSHRTKNIHRSKLYTGEKERETETDTDTERQRQRENVVYFGLCESKEQKTTNMLFMRSKFSF